MKARRPTQKRNIFIFVEETKAISYVRQVTIFQETARNHFREAGMLMQSYVVETVDQPLLNNTYLVCSRGNGFYANYRGQSSSSVFSLFQQYITVN